MHNTPNTNEQNPQSQVLNSKHDQQHIFDMFLCRRINVTRDDITRVQNFCQAIQQKQDRYGSRDRSRGDTGKHRFLNGFVGKIGEVGAAKIFGGTVDFRVWATGQRGLDQFEPDIASSSSTYNLHVKTCHMKHTKRSPRGVVPTATASWTIDVSDPLMKNPADRDRIILMFASDYGDVQYLGWIDAKQALPFWKPCLSSTLSHKRAIYMNDIWQYIEITTI